MRFTALTTQQMLGVSNLIILWAVMGGKRLERSDDKLWDLVERLNDVFRAGEVSVRYLTSFFFSLSLALLFSPRYVVYSIRNNETLS